MTSMHTGKVSGPRRASVSDTSDSARELLHHRSNPHPWNLHSQRKIWKKIMRHFSCGKRSCLSFANRVTITRRLNFASLIPQMGQELGPCRRRHVYTQSHRIHKDWFAGGWWLGR